VPTARVERALISIAPGEPARHNSIRSVAAQIVNHLDGREVVVFVTLGDPNVYSIFPAIAEAVRAERPNVPVETVPGVMAFQELAARSGTVIADEGNSVRIVACGADIGDYAERIDASLGEPRETLVMYRGGRHLPALAATMDRHHRRADAVVGELLGLPGEQCAAVDDVSDRPASYLATIIAPATTTTASKAATNVTAKARRG
jgi:precorrin-2/cobalt-factor-2 C20-methyltransferase